MNDTHAELAGKWALRLALFLFIVVVLCVWWAVFVP